MYSGEGGAVEEIIDPFFLFCFSSFFSPFNDIFPFVS